MHHKFLLGLLALVLCASVYANEIPNKGVCTENCMSNIPHDVINLGDEVVHVDSVFTPKGFDENDHVEIMASGYLPSPCFRRPYGSIEKAGNDIKITVRAARMASRDRICIEMAVPYLISIPVGPVVAGKYTVTVNTATNIPLFSEMEIEPSTNGTIDNFLYAKVEQVSVDRKTRTVTLRGENPSPCIELEKIISTSNGFNTYAVMPIMRQKDAICPQVITPFEYTYQLPDDLHAPKVLVHVRTLDGNSKNAVFSASN